MSHEKLQPEPKAENKILHHLTLNPLKVKEQIIINKEIGIRICRTRSNLASINIACANGTEICLPQKEDHVFRPKSNELDYTFLPIQLEKGKWAQIGNYKIRAAITKGGIVLNIEARRPIKTERVAKRSDLREVLANLSKADNQKPQLSKLQEPLHILDSSQE